MGVWGAAIFSDDTACDIRGIYKELLGDGISPSDATDRILIEWKDSFNDPYEESVIWLALAVTQWNLGCLEERVKDKAIDIVSSGSDLNRWEGEDREKRKKVLEKTKAQLESPQPEAKKIRKTFRDHCDRKVGELVAYSTLSKDKILFRVIGFHEDRGGKAPILAMISRGGT